MTEHEAGRERIARGIFGSVCLANISSGVAMVSTNWDDLPEHIKRTYLEEADQIISDLHFHDLLIKEKDEKLET